MRAVISMIVFAFSVISIASAQSAYIPGVCQSMGNHMTFFSGSPFLINQAKTAADKIDRSIYLPFFTAAAYFEDSRFPLRRTAAGAMENDDDPGDYLVVGLFVGSLASMASGLLTLGFVDSPAVSWTLFGVGAAGFVTWLVIGLVDYGNHR